MYSPDFDDSDDEVSLGDEYAFMVHQFNGPVPDIFFDGLDGDFGDGFLDDDDFDDDYNDSDFR